MKKTIFLLTIFLFCQIFMSNDMHSASLSYSNAPPCSMDINRNYNVFKAIQALNKASSATNFNAARNELLNAYSNLEQVMNYGALQWSECVSCDPYKSIDGNGAHSYMNVAKRLVSLSRKIHERPDYNEFLGLVETMENRVQTDQYCGDFAKTSNVSGVNHSWEFGRVSPQQMVLCETSKFALTDNNGPHGKKIKSCHSNESFYWLLNNEIVFVDWQGYVTSILYSGGNEHWEGPYKADINAKITHYIKKDNNNKTDPCGRPSWYDKTVAPEVAYSGSYGFPSKSSWAKDGVKYWLINSTGFCNQYFVLNGNDIHLFDYCGNEISILKFERSKTNDLGHQTWEGYTLMPDGSKGRSWWMSWL